MHHPIQMKPADSENRNGEYKTIFHIHKIKPLSQTHIKIVYLPNLHTEQNLFIEFHNIIFMFLEGEMDFYHEIEQLHLFTIF